jgi:hypothetical protein
LSPRTRSAELLLKLGGGAGQLSRFGVQPLGQGPVGGSFGVEPFP